MIITKKDWKIVDAAMEDVLSSLHIVAPNTGNILNFSGDGYWQILDSDGKRIKKYQVFENAVNYLLEND